jgi:hypothetical protein
MEIAWHVAVIFSVKQMYVREDHTITLKCLGIREQNLSVARKSVTHLSCSQKPAYRWVVETNLLFTLMPQITAKYVCSVSIF